MFKLFTKLEDLLGYFLIASRPDSAQSFRQLCGTYLKEITQMTKHSEAKLKPDIRKLLQHIPDFITDQNSAMHFIFTTMTADRVEISISD